MYITVLTTAQARPMVFPTVPVSDKTEPVPTEITMETSVQVKDETSEQTSVADKPDVEKSEFFFLGILKIYSVNCLDFYIISSPFILVFLLKGPY